MKSWTYYQMLSPQTRICPDGQDIQNPPILTGYPSLVLINKKKELPIKWVFLDPAEHKMKMTKIKKKKKKNIDKYLDLARVLLKRPVVIGALRTVSKGLRKSLEGLEIRGRIETIQTVEIGLNTGKSPGELIKHAVTYTTVKVHQLTLSSSKMITLLLLLLIIMTRVECSPMVRETRVQSQVESY